MMENSIRALNRILFNLAKWCSRFVRQYKPDCTCLHTDSREPDKKRSFLSNVFEYFCLGVPCDIMSHLKISKCT